MLTVVQFVEMNKAQRATNRNRNKIYTRSLRKIGFIDNRYPSDGSVPYPKDREHWVVEIDRENQSSNGGGCFILKPLIRVEDEDLHPLVHGMYDLKRDGDAVLIVPKDQTKYWVMSPVAKGDIQESFGDKVASVVISYQGESWTRRPPPESVLEKGVEKMFGDALNE